MKKNGVDKNVVEHLEPHTGETIDAYLGFRVKQLYDRVTASQICKIHIPVFLFQQLEYGSFDSFIHHILDTCHTAMNNTEMVPALLELTEQ